jgi:hypothetical protein
MIRFVDAGPAKPKAATARAALAAAEAALGVKPVSTPPANKRPVSTPTPANRPTPVSTPAEPVRTDRKTYQRDLMRARRAAAKLA